MKVGHLRIYFAFVLAAMLAVTIWASLEQNVIEGFASVTQFRWGWATLADTYFAFLAFYLWVHLRERSWIARAGWLMAILLLGNFAMAAYALIAMKGLKPADEVPRGPA